MEKESEATHSLYNFEADDQFKTLLDKPVKEEEERVVKNDSGDKEGSYPMCFCFKFFDMLWYFINSMPNGANMYNLKHYQKYSNTFNMSYYYVFQFSQLDIMLNFINIISRF